MIKNFRKSIDAINAYGATFEKLDVRDLNIANLTFNEVRMYINFLEIIYERYESIGREYHSVQKELQASMKSGTSPMTKEQMELWDKSSDLGVRLRLEIEAFLVFSHILLNKLTNYPENYFTHKYKRGLTCGSHHQFWATVRNKDYFSPIDEELNAEVEWLQANVIGHRDHLITHTVEKEQQRRMLIKGLTFQGDGKGFRTMSTTLYPDEKVSGQADSPAIEEIVPRLEKYIELYFEFLKKHKDKSTSAHL